jgi:hypothetical protein
MPPTDSCFNQRKIERPYTNLYAIICNQTTKNNQVALCGAISEYDSKPIGITNYSEYSYSGSRISQAGIRISGAEAI